MTTKIRRGDSVPSDLIKFRNRYLRLSVVVVRMTSAPERERGHTGVRVLLETAPDEARDALKQLVAYGLARREPGKSGRAFTLGNEGAA